MTGTVPQPNAELDAAHTCLRAGVAERLMRKEPAPAAEERWDWAVRITAACEDRIIAAANSGGSVYVLGDHAHSSISKLDLLRAEANYFVDRLIREHYEAKA
ncbi:hypothetical protein [Erythrobacter oryzae]|uniref:hypothetical protein n=1 Tax=Erythrobacter oryzae TaxID=3019556 RepID=UPI0025542EF1|nr:hypothetical protein [Erythrobacter sp. COR-2]